MMADEMMELADTSALDALIETAARESSGAGDARVVRLARGDGTSFEVRGGMFGVYALVALPRIERARFTRLGDAWALSGHGRRDR